MTYNNTFWRTLIRIENVDDDFVYAVIPARCSKAIKIPRNDVPDNVLSKLIPNTIFRVHAQINWGVHKTEDLVIKDWEEE